MLLNLSDYGKIVKNLSKNEVHPMKTNIALLRGINVSGQKLIKMEHLRALFAELHFQNIRSYIQSGNVIFDAPLESSTTLLGGLIEDAIKGTFGFDVPVIVRTVDEIEEVVTRNPFAGVELSKEEKFYVSFLTEEPTAEAIAKLDSFKNDVDDYIVQNREVYILCRVGYGNSLFSNNFLEKQLRVTATTRNWNTVNKLLSMTKS
ncbi:hypothetical protein Back11_42210 [Paenibacillus baekrokdamisoli]|uniref:DUF1697 domain-containing protein n=1 Tax=Paenibacillus baekrokdamisoli TaxID=1712516 RepID=A0A3G9IWI4_9BACL|nr:hypothetical protein Back11_42210 [Paenibacillus baekrokdamisoli]